MESDKPKLRICKHCGNTSSSDEVVDITKQIDKSLEKSKEMRTRINK